MIRGTRQGLKDMKSVLLSESLAKKLFSDADPINQVVTMDARWDLKVTGVYERTFIIEYSGVQTSPYDGLILLCCTAVSFSN